MNPNPPEANPVRDLGKMAWNHVIYRAYVRDSPQRVVLALAWPMLGVGLLAVGLILFRLSRKCAGLVHLRPRTFRLLHAPWLVPLGLGAGGLGLALIAPGYIASIQPYRPEAWPSFGSIRAETAYQAIAVGLFAGLVAVGMTMYRAGRDGKDHAKGSARWARWKDVQVHPAWRWSIPIRASYRGALSAWTGGAGKTALAPSDDVAVRHLLLIGQTGSGKGFTVFSNIIASSKTPFVYQDVKGQCPGLDLVEAKFGRAPIRWGCAAQDGWPSLGWNPLEECRQDPRPTDAFAALAAILVPGRSDSDWVADLTRPILAHVLEHGGFGTLGEVQDALLAHGVDQVLASAQVPQGLLAALEGKNTREYLGTTLFAALNGFHSGWGRAVTSTHDFDLAKVCRTCTYVLSAEPEATRRTPLIVFWQLLFRRLLQSSKVVPTTLLFDEALAAGKIPSVRDALATLRDRRVSIVFGTQHLSGLREVYGQAEGESLIASFTSRIVLLNGLDPRDREWVVKTLGQRTLVEKRNKTTTTTAIPLLTLDDLNRRASREGAFWAVIEGPGMTRTGEAIMARMVGGPKDLIRQPTTGEQAVCFAQALQGPGVACTGTSPKVVDLDEL